MIADGNNQRVIEVNQKNQIVWSYGSCTGTELSGAAFASRLPNGHTLITDSNNNRALGVTKAGVVVFEYDTNTRPDSVAMPLPPRAARRKNGDTLISDQFNMQVIEIDPNKNIVFRSCDSIDCVATITIRRLDESTKTRLRRRAAGHGRSREEEAREILKVALTADRAGPSNLAGSIRRLFAALGGVDLPDLQRERMRQPPHFRICRAYLAV